MNVTVIIRQIEQDRNSLYTIQMIINNDDKSPMVGFIDFTSDKTSIYWGPKEYRIFTISLSYELLVKRYLPKYCSVDGSLFYRREIMTLKSL